MHIKSGIYATVFQRVTIKLGKPYFSGYSEYVGKTPSAYMCKKAPFEKLWAC